MGTGRADGEERGGWTRSRHINRKAGGIWGKLILVEKPKFQVKVMTMIKHDDVMCHVILMLGDVGL